jgi:hypothetical protein
MISGLTSLVCTVAQNSTFNASVVIMNIYEHIKYLFGIMWNNHLRIIMCNMLKDLWFVNYTISKHGKVGSESKCNKENWVWIDYLHPLFVLFLAFGHAKL